MKHSLLIRNISNLTDARFFAALQPDYLALAKNDDPEKWLELFEALQPWIEGPQWILDLPAGISTQYVDYILGKEPSISGVIAAADQLSLLSGRSVTRVLDVASDQIPNEGFDFVLLTAQRFANSWSEVKGETPTYIQIESVDEWNKIVSLPVQVSGVVLMGSEEEKIGFKSFEEYDILIEALN